MTMYNHVNIEAVGIELPEEIVSSDEIEARLSPLYERLHLPEGRLELMTGIRNRRFWGRNTRPSEAAARAGYNTLRAAEKEPSSVDALVFCGVSKDCVEPATATMVHHALGLRPDAVNFDISNACLGLMSGVLILANMVELGQIECGLAVSGENARPLVDSTIQALNSDLTLTRKMVKDQFASLTIGSGAAAILVCRREISQSGHRVLAASTFCNTAGSTLCRGDVAGGMTDGNTALMATDSHQLMVQGVEVASCMWEKLKTEVGWTNDSPDVICGHQVGKFHRELLFQTLGLDLTKDFPTYPDFGNCGSVSVMLTCALAEKAGVLDSGKKLALLGIGSGINSTGLAVEW